MATPGELIKRVADVTGIAEATATTYYRALREAGQVTKGGRGRSAAHSTVRDAARLLIAVGGSRFEKQPADRIVEEYSAAVSTHSALTGEGLDINDTGVWQLRQRDVALAVPALSELPDRHTVEDAVAALLKASIRESFSRAVRNAFSNCRPLLNVEVSMHGPQTSAGITIGVMGIAEETVIFSFREEMTYISNGGDVARGDLKIVRTFSQETIFAVADLLRPDYYRGSGVDGYPLDPNHPCYANESREEREKIRIAAEAEIDRREVEWADE